MSHTTRKKHKNSTLKLAVFGSLSFIIVMVAIGFARKTYHIHQAKQVVDLATKTGNKVTKISKQIKRKDITFYIARHAQTDANVKGLYAGSGTDAHLTTMGRYQAKGAGKDLQNIKFARVYTSELTRTQDTAKLILSQNKSTSKKVSHTILRDLNDLDWGKVEGLSPDEISKKYPNFFKDYDLGSVDDLTFKPKYEIESTAHAVMRFDRAFDHILYEAKDGDTILVVGHSSLAWWFQKNMPNSGITSIQNAEVIKVRYHKGQMSVL